MLGALALDRPLVLSIVPPVDVSVIVPVELTAPLRVSEPVPDDKVTLLVPFMVALEFNCVKLPPFAARVTLVPDTAPSTLIAPLLVNVRDPALELLASK